MGYNCICNLICIFFQYDELCIAETRERDHSSEKVSRIDGASSDLHLPYVQIRGHLEPFSGRNGTSSVRFSNASNHRLHGSGDAGIGSSQLESASTEIDKKSDSQRLNAVDGVPAVQNDLTTQELIIMKHHMRRVRAANRDRERLRRYRTSSSRSLDDRPGSKQQSSFKRLGSFPGLIHTKSGSGGEHVRNQSADKPEVWLRQERQTVEQNHKSVAVPKDAKKRHPYPIHAQISVENEELPYKSRDAEYKPVQAKFAVGGGSKGTVHKSTPQQNRASDAFGACALDLASSSSSSSSLDDWHHVQTTTAEICATPAASVERCVNESDHPVWQLNDKPTASQQSRLNASGGGSKVGLLMLAPQTPQSSAAATISNNMMLDSDTDSLSSGEMSYHLQTI